MGATNWPDHSVTVKRRPRCGADARDLFGVPCDQLSCNIGDHCSFGIERRKEHDLVEPGVIEFGDPVPQLVGCADETRPLDQFLGDKPLLFRDHPAVVAEVRAQVATLRRGLFGS